MKTSSKIKSKAVTILGGVMDKSAMKPILPLSGDVVFKGFFGNKKHKKYLIHLLNYYTNIEIGDNESYRNR